jgi:outer membrane lipoprotein-sorting protein
MTMVRIGVRKGLVALMAGLVLCAAASLPQAAAAAAQQAALSPDASAALVRAERYLNDISTLSARFIQISSNGVYAEGTLAVSRPGKLRFEYDPPAPILMIANGLSFLYYDKELEQATYLPLWETPLWFLIRDEVELNDKIRVQEVEQLDNDLRITLADPEAEAAGQVTLVFAEQPFRLIRWELLDAQGIRTEVTLVNPTYGGKVEAKLFDIGTLGLDRNLTPD